MFANQSQNNLTNGSWKLGASIQAARKMDVMGEFNTHKWSHISDLPDNWQSELVDISTAAIVKAWLEQAEELRGKTLYGKFLGKLHREWAIETGVIEGIYSISEGGTKTLIEKGLDASFLSHEDTDLPAQEVIAKIKDQEAAIHGLYDFVSCIETEGNDVNSGGKFS